MIKTILFDLDGTITDPKEGITKSVAYALSHFSIHVKDLDELIPFIGPPLLDSFMEYYHLTQTQAREAVEKYRAYFEEKGMYENIPYEGIERFLEDLRKQGIQCVIATSKPEIFAKRILEYFSLITYFDDVCGASMDESRIHKGDVIAYAMRKHQLDVQSTIMVGDRKHDVIGAFEHGLPCVGVLYGYGSFEELRKAKATHIVANLQELATYIQLHK